VGGVDVESVLNRGGFRRKVVGMFDGGAGFQGRGFRFSSCGAPAMLGIRR
jgi:hypothetical protein